MCQQEEAEANSFGGGTGENQCHPSAYNRRLQASKSSNDIINTTRHWDTTDSY